MGAWIETGVETEESQEETVAPLVGAWIETTKLPYVNYADLVAPLVGAWIETVAVQGSTDHLQSHPSWVRGLKPQLDYAHCGIDSRTPRGCVD